MAFSSSTVDALPRRLAPPLWGAVAGLPWGLMVGLLVRATSSAVAVSLIVDLQMIPFALVGAAILLARRGRHGRARTAAPS